MKVDNKQIARAVFFKLRSEGNDAAALRLVSAMFQYSTITLNISDIDCLIESELERFGCKFSLRRNGDFALFSFHGQTEIEPEKWQKLCKEIYE